MRESLLCRCSAGLSRRRFALARLAVAQSAEAAGLRIAGLKAPRYTIVAAAVGALALLFAFDPATTPFFPSCPFRLLTGWSCPGCGTLRAVHALLHGHFGVALHDNPFVLAVGFVFAGATTVDRVRGHRATSAVSRLTSPSALLVLAIAATVFAVARNLPAHSFVWIP